MSRRIYSRRHVELSWLDAAATKKQKPVDPLRYRIAPWEKKLDTLDKHERELVAQWDAKQIEWDEYEQLLAVIESQREALDVRRLKAIGEYVKPVKEAPERPVRLKEATVKAVYRPAANTLTPFQFKLCVLVAIFLIIVIHNA